MIGIGDVLNLIRNVDRLLSADTKYGKAIERLDAEIAELKDCVTRIETREEIVIIEAKDAARTAATQVSIASFADMARRIGRLEERSGQGRLSAPE